jgi:hypothetical protein
MIGQPGKPCASNIRFADILSPYAFAMGQRKMGRDVRFDWVKNPLRL